MTILPETPGIYKIVCIPTSKVYVGSTKNLRSRWAGHRKELRGLRHHSLLLQRAWNKYGEGAFLFEVLEVVMFVEYLIEREQYWIDMTQCFDPQHGFNRRRVAEGNAGVRYSDEARAKIRAARATQVFTEATRQKMSASQRGKKMSPESIEKTRQASIGRKRTKEQCLAQSERMKGVRPGFAGAPNGKALDYIVTSPQGDVQKIHGLRKFCQERSLCYDNMLCVAKGRFKQHKGWKCVRATAADGDLVFG